MSLTKRSVAEFMGTFWLVFGGCGSAVLAAGEPKVGIGVVFFGRISGNSQAIGAMLGGRVLAVPDLHCIGIIGDRLQQSAVALLAFPDQFLRLPVFGHVAQYEQDRVRRAAAPGKQGRRKLSGDRRRASPGRR